jgi:diguanylate cyclase (GGDEF)-like protein/PAS domain S-box-containing protein
MGVTVARELHIPGNLRGRRLVVELLPTLCTAVAFAVLAHYDLAGHVPLWGLLLMLAACNVAAVVGSALITPTAAGWVVSVGIAAQMASVTALIYAVGWGATLAVGYVFVASRAIADAGARTWRISAGWALASVLAGQAGIAAGLVPSYVPEPYTHALAGLSVLGTAVVIAVLGQRTAETEAVRAVLEGEIQDRTRADQELREALSLLTATLDSTPDGIIVVGSDARVSHFNARVLDMWGLPRSMLEARGSGALAHIMGQLVHPEQFLSAMEEVSASAGRESFDLLECRDGRLLERYSRPQRVDGEVVGRVWSFRDVTARTELEHKLVHQAFHDSLTGVANTTLFNERLEHAIARAQRWGGGLAVLFLDVDNFKAVNDGFGHGAGDSLLVHIGEVLRRCARSADTVARLGGDEFAILTEDVATPSHALALADRIVAAMRQATTVDGNPVVATVSVGVAVYEPGWTSVEMLRNADLAMYAAKQLGKDRHVEYRGEMYRVIAERMAVENDLHDALDLGQLVVHYQPIVELSTERLVGFEALVRWQHPERGLLSPDEFVRVAEDAGLIEQIDRHVLTDAAREAAAWGRPGASYGPGGYLISVNVSARRLIDPSLTADVAAVMQDLVPASATLVLEVTESAMLRDTETAIEQLRAVRALGAKVALDDFGTGYSSLAHLRQLPIDILKIDRTFVGDLTRDEAGDRGVASAILQLSRSMGLDCIAEGVESPAQAAALRRLGCALAQGMYLGPPLDTEGARRMVNGSRARAGARS